MKCLLLCLSTQNWIFNINSLTCWWCISIWALVSSLKCLQIHWHLMVLGHWQAQWWMQRSLANVYFLIVKLNTENANWDLMRYDIIQNVDIKKCHQISWYFVSAQKINMQTQAIHPWVYILFSVYHKISNIRCTKSQNLNDSNSVLQLSLPNPLKPGVKSRMIW